MPLSVAVKNAVAIRMAESSVVIRIEGVIDAAGFEKWNVKLGHGSIRIPDMERSGLPTKSNPTRRRTKIWVAAILFDMLIVVGVVYYFFFRTDTSPDFSVAADMPVQGELIDPPPSVNDPYPFFDDDDYEDDLDEPVDPLIAMIDKLLEETADVEGLEFESDPVAAINNPEHAKYQPIAFEDIADWSPYEQLRDDNTIEIPASAMKYDGQWVAVRGFMQPVRQQDRKVKRFMLMRNQALCCFGAAIGLSDWIDVTIPGEPIELMMHLPITVLGKIDIGEEMEDGLTVSIFRMQCDKVLPPGELP